MMASHPLDLRSACMKNELELDQGFPQRRGEKRKAGKRVRNAAFWFHAQQLRRPSGRTRVLCLCVCLMLAIGEWVGMERVPPAHKHGSGGRRRREGGDGQTIKQKKHIDKHGFHEDTSVFMTY